MKTASAEKVFVSGVGPGSAGASRFFDVAERHARAHGYEVIYPYRHISLRNSLKSRGALYTLGLVISNILKRIIFTYKAALLKDKEVIVAHPQGIGLITFFILAFRNSKIRIFVLDNSAFCVKSYNYHRLQNGECLRCLGLSSEPYRDCRSFPGTRLRFLHRLFIRHLHHYCDRYEFLFQNTAHLELHRAHFGDRFVGKVIGLETSDMDAASNTRVQKSIPSVDLTDEIPIEKATNLSQAIVFHGTAEEAKGSLVALKLAADCPNLIFIFPFDRSSLKLNNGEIPENCVFFPCQWETGLEKLVTACAGVLCPSQWSAPIEGALVKSIYLNGLVLVESLKFGFEKEFPANTLVRIDQKSFDESILLSILADDDLESRKNKSRSAASSLNRKSTSELFS